MEGKVVKLLRECYPNNSIMYSSYVVSKIKKENLITKVVDDKLITALLLRDDVLAVGERHIEVKYVSHLGTKISERKKGNATNLLISSMNKMRDENVIAIVINPEEHSLYEKIGFVTYAYSEKSAIYGSYDVTHNLELKDIKAIKSLYNESNKNSYVHQVRTEEDFKRILTSCEIEGEAVGYFGANGLEAYHLSLEDKDEIAAQSDFYLNKLGIHSYDKKSAHGKERTMIRVIDIIQFLNNITYPKGFEIDMKIKLMDEIIEKNNMIIHLKVENGIGVCEKTNDRTYDLDYLVPDLVSTIMRNESNDIKYI